MSSVFDISKYRLAMNWKVKATENGFIILTHERNIGCMLVNLSKNLVLVHDSSQPDWKKVQQQVEFQLDHQMDQEQLDLRILQAESSAISNNRQSENRHMSLFDVFPHLSETYAVIYDKWTTRYVRLDAEQYQQYIAAKERLNTGHASEIYRQHATNILLVLTGSSFNDDLVIYRDGNWQGTFSALELTDEPFLTDDWIYCPKCQFIHGFQHFEGDMASHRRSQYEGWLNHSKTGCTGHMRDGS